MILLWQQRPMQLIKISRNKIDLKRYLRSQESEVRSQEGRTMVRRYRSQEYFYLYFLLVTRYSFMLRQKFRRLYY